MLLEARVKEDMGVLREKRELMKEYRVLMGEEKYVPRGMEIEETEEIDE